MKIDGDTDIISSVLCMKAIQKYRKIRDKLEERGDMDGVKHYEKIINTLEDTLDRL